MYETNNPVKLAFLQPSPGLPSLHMKGVLISKASGK